MSRRAAAQCPGCGCYAVLALTPVAGDVWLACPSCGPQRYAAYRPAPDPPAIAPAPPRARPTRPIGRPRKAPHGAA